jgi:hypothetical protein
VRWEKVDHVRLTLANETYRISPEQVATKVIDQMLVNDKHHWKRSMGRWYSSPGVNVLPLATFFSFDHNRPSPT